MWRVETRRLAGRKCANSCICVCDRGRSLRAVSRARQRPAAFEWSRLARHTFLCLGIVQEVLRLNKLRERKPALRESRPRMVLEVIVGSLIVAVPEKLRCGRGGRTGRKQQPCVFFLDSFLPSSLQCSFPFFRKLREVTIAVSLNGKERHG